MIRKKFGNKSERVTKIRSKASNSLEHGDIQTNVASLEWMKEVTSLIKWSRKTRFRPDFSRDTRIMAKRATQTTNKDVINKEVTFPTLLYEIII